MKEEIKIRKGKDKDIINASDLVYKTFKKFNANEGPKEAVEKYLGFHDTKKNLENIKEGYRNSRIFFIAEDNGKIIGVIRGSELRIGSLFVDEKYHKKGIARKLLKKFEKEAEKYCSRKIKVRASLYSIEFYKKAGYKKSTGIKKGIGLNFQPMIKKLEN